jgi:hypothetical protein
LNAKLRHKKYAPNNATGIIEYPAMNPKLSKIIARINGVTPYEAAIPVIKFDILPEGSANPSET